MRVPSTLANNAFTELQEAIDYACKPVPSYAKHWDLPQLYIAQLPGKRCLFTVAGEIWFKRFVPDAAILCAALHGIQH